MVSLGRHRLPPTVTGVPKGYFEHARPEVAGLVRPTSRRILDLGCGAGALGASLREPNGFRVVVGLEGDPAAAAVAAERLDDAQHLDLEDLCALRGFFEAHTEPFDCLIASDVLEHLRDPWGVLELCVSALAESAQVLVSVPNVRVLSVLGPLLLRGRFDYRDHGVLDRTHLRFFTRCSARALVEGAGVSIDSVLRAPTPWRTGWKARLGGLVGDLGNEQFLIVGTRRT